ncbi:MAG: type II secretion system F family protein [Notoacmeibacter sp.]|nr:type II secretion system F family protein [Notoacmeibacter sp.]
MSGLLDILPFDLPGGSAMIAVILLLAGGVAMAWPLLSAGTGRGDMKRRLHVDAEETGETVADAAAETRRRSSEAVRDKALKKAQEFYAKSDPENVAKIRMKLIQAGYMDPGSVAWFFLARFAALIACMVLAVLYRVAVGADMDLRGWMIAAGAGLSGYFLPGLVLSRQISAKMREYRNGFPDFMDLMVVCSDAGMSMEAGIERVGREIAKTYPSLSENLQLVSIELRAGRSMNDALKALADRLGLDEVRAFATLLQQSKELGTSLSNALRVFSDEMRHKRMSLAEEKAHALPAKMSVPVTMCILPVVLLIAIIPVIVQISEMK